MSAYYTLIARLCAFNQLFWFRLTECISFSSQIRQAPEVTPWAEMMTQRRRSINI